MNASDGLIEAIADAVARRLETWSGLEQRLLGLEEAAKYLGLSVHALRHKAGVEIPSVKIDGKLRFDRREIDRYIDRAPRNGV